MKFYTRIHRVLLGFLISITVVAGLNGAVASAQVVSPAPVAAACLSLQSNLGYGAGDFNTGNAVSALQSFLSNRGFFSSLYLGSGHFGAITFNAVAKFQASQGLPATGYVGPLTRAAIASVTCWTTVTPPSSTAAHLYSINPTAGAVGTMVSITGFGFTNNNTVLMDGSIAASNVPIASSIAIACTTNPSCHGGINQTITFNVPSSLSPNCPAGLMCPMYVRLVTPATYAIAVQNSNGTSNTLNLTVTGGTNTQPLSVSGLDAPASLALGQVGTWAVHVNTSTANTDLHYSVIWGDEASLGASIMAPQTTTVQSSATFMHAYSRSGNYTPTFTVTDDSGHSVTTSSTVVVTQLY